MDLTFTRGDDPDAVRENFRLIGRALDIRPEDMVYAMQTHTTNVIEATKAERGMGVIKDRCFRISMVL